jgi:phenylacetate-CoA ligase
MWNRQIECLARIELENLQLSRLKTIAALTYERVPFYKKLFDDAGFNPATLKTLYDLRQVPFTRKSDLRDNYPFGLFCVPESQVSRLHASSGTRGKPTVVGYTKNDLEVWAEIVARSLTAAGVHRGDVVHNSYGYGLFTGGMGLHSGAELMGATVVPASGGRTHQQIMLMQDFGARVLCSTPSYALNIAFSLEEMGIDRNSLSLAIGIFGAEPWTEPMRQELERRLGIKALDIYGLSEIMGPGIAMECAQGRNGLHIWEDHFLAEVIDPSSGEPLPLGEEGELVFTSLTKEAMPLIRYRTGDLARLIGERCPCGRTMMRMSRVRARLDDMLIVRGVNLYPSEVEKVLLQVDELSPHYQLVLERQKALDTLEVQVEVTDHLIARWGKIEDGRVEFDALKNKIEDLLKDSLGLTAAIKLLPPNSIKRSEGKAVRVIDRRQETDES